jgi:DNA (cytosine-5)-methyltransferase 1
MMLTAVDLFCGAGGLTAGLTKAGFDIIGAVDYWRPAIKTYCRNFNYPVILADICAISENEFKSFIESSSRQVDLLVGGPPCQSFPFQRSRASKDDRAGLISEFARYVILLHPRMFLMECKLRALDTENQVITARFESILTRAGYCVRSQIVNAAEYGVPQVRKRVFYYGWLRDEVQEFSFPRPNYNSNIFRTVEDVIGDLPHLSDTNTYSNDPYHYFIKTLDINLERLRNLPPGGNVGDLPYDLQPTHYKYRKYKNGYHGAYGRLHPDKPSVAIIDGFDSFTRGKFGHPYQNRNITLREGARLQTFPDNFLFEGSQRDITALIGNATPPLLAETIACAMASHLKGVVVSIRESHPFDSLSQRKKKPVLKKENQPLFEIISNAKREEEIQVGESLVSDTNRFHSCFICYSSKDLELAKRIYVDLKSKGVRCWFAPEDLKIGEKFRTSIDETIRVYDKLLLIFSEHSISSPWVESEVEAALEHEVEQNRTMLFPVRLDNSVMKIKTGWPADIRRTRHIGDFTGWRTKRLYQKAFNKLLRDLKAEIKDSYSEGSRLSKHSTQSSPLSLRMPNSRNAGLDV